MVRATFDLHLAGEPQAVERATVDLSDKLAEAGFIYDEDFEALIVEAGRLTGLRLHALDALALVSQCLSAAEVYAIETKPELV